MALDLRIKRRRGSESDGEERDMDKKKSPKYSMPGKSYRFRIRHVCKDCDGILRLMIDQGDIKPLNNASHCPSCGHKSMHQCYYNLCSMCVRLLRRCAMCCSDRNADHIDPRDVILTPTLKAVLEIFPQPYRRVLLRFVFKKWEAYLSSQDFPIEEFRHQFMTMAYDFIDDIYMKQSLIEAPNLQDTQVQELLNMQKESAYRIADRVVNENVAYLESEDEEKEINMDLHISKILRTNQWLQDMVKPLPGETEPPGDKKIMKQDVITGIKSVQQQLIDIHAELECVLHVPYAVNHTVSPIDQRATSKSDHQTPTKDESKNYVINLTDDTDVQEEECKKSDNISVGPSQQAGKNEPIFIDLTNSGSNSEVTLDETASTFMMRTTLASEESRLQLLSQQLEIAINALKVWDKKDTDDNNDKLSKKPVSNKGSPIASCSTVDRENIKNINFADIKINFNKAFYKSDTINVAEENQPNAKSENIIEDSDDEEKKEKPQNKN